MSKYKNTIISIGVMAVLLALFIVPKLGKPSITGEGSGAPCLVSNVPLVIHIHPQLTIMVDGKNEPVPANIGLGGSCERALHTHDATGTLHVESQTQQSYTLDDFYKTWGLSIQRTGYAVVMTVDGKPSQEFGKLMLVDKQQIEVVYTKISQ